MFNKQIQAKGKDNNNNDEKLDLSGKIWQEVDRIISLPRYHHIRILTVNNSSLATIPVLPHKIEKLDLSRNHIDRIQGLHNLSFLRILQLSHNEIRRIEGLSKSYQLQELYLSHNHIRDVENLYHLQMMHTLDIRFNQLSHIDLLKRLEDNLNLRALFVDGNKFTIKAQNYQTIIFQMLPFLDFADGKAIEQAMNGNSKNNNYYKQPKQRRFAKRRNKSMSSLHDRLNKNEPRYMTGTISNKLKRGYGEQKLNSHHSHSRSSAALRTSRKSSQKYSYEHQYQSQSRSNQQQTLKEFQNNTNGNNKNNLKPSAWTNFGHYSMKPGSKRKSIYDYSTPKKKANTNMTKNLNEAMNIPCNKLPPKRDSKPNHGTKKVRDTLLSPVSSLPGPDQNEILQQHIMDSAKSQMSNQPKTRMKDVIKKLNEKINKLYSWHLVEIDLVSKQQMQLNDLRSELSTTRASLSTFQNSTLAPTPLRLLDTPASAAISLAIEKDIAPDNLSTITTRSALQLDNPNFIKHTLQKCYQILKRDNASATELEAVENLVQQLESDMAANAQLEYLQKKQLQKNSAEKKRKTVMTDQDSVPSVPIKDESIEVVSVPVKDESIDISSDRNETNSMMEQFNAYNEEITKLEKELMSIDVSNTEKTEVVNDVTANNINNENTETATQSKDVENTDPNKRRKQYVQLKSNPSSSGNSKDDNIKIKKKIPNTNVSQLKSEEKDKLNEWLSELADELNTAKLSLKHLMDISSQDTENRKAKVKEFNIVASKCDMFSSFDVDSKIYKIMDKLSENSQIEIQHYLHELQMTKDSIQKLILYIIQLKPENDIQKQRNKIIDRNLTKTESYNLSLDIIEQ